MKKRGIAIKLYIVFVVLLLALMGWALKQLWDFCDAYQKGCAETVLKETAEEVGRQYGLDLSYSSVPVVDANGDSVFNLKADGKTVGKARLSIREHGLLSLALYELKDVEGILEFSYEAPDDVAVTAAQVALEPLSTRIYPGMEQLKELEGNMAPPSVYSCRAKGLFSRDQVSWSIKGEVSSRIRIEEKGSGSDKEPIRLLQYFRDEAEAEKLKARAIEIAEKYSNYISKDVNWNKLAGYIMKDSPLRSSIPTMEIQWYNWHSKAEVRNADISEPLILNEYYVLVNTRYDYVITREGKEYTVPTELALFLHLDDDGVYRLAALNTHINE
ncbi:MAG: hypothetical protein IJM08_05140 [Firmicutes bacterium]|nr:hypothetical protein [Bacillota bacterium]